MSWLSSLAKQGEALLDNLDKQAGAAIETAEKKISHKIKETRENEGGEGELTFDTSIPNHIDRSGLMPRTFSPKHSRNSSRDLRFDRDSPRNSPTFSSVLRRPPRKGSDEECEIGIRQKAPTPPSGRTTPGTNFGNSESEFELVSASGSMVGVGEKREDPIDLQLENKLLRQEMNSLNIEISRLMDMHRKTERELSLTNSELQRRRQSTVDEKDAELAVAMKEKESRAKEMDHRETQYELEKSALSEALAKSQIILQRERTKATESQAQCRTYKSGLERIQTEFEEYKLKSQRILQSKEKIIDSLKNSDSHSEGTTTEASVIIGLNVKIEELQHEIDMMKEENRSYTHQIQTLRADLQQSESQATEDFEISTSQYHEIEINFEQNQKKLNELTPEISRLRLELGQAQRESDTARREISRTVAEKDREIGRLRSQVMNHASNSELEKRLRAMTETLIGKQTTIESLSAEKSSLSLELERLRSFPRQDVSSPTLRKRGHVEIDAEALITDSTNDAVGKMKRAFGALDKLSIRLGVLLKRYPTVRLLVILYMIMLHVWTSVVLVTYEPEVHGPILPQDDVMKAILPDEAD